MNVGLLQTQRQQLALTNQLRQAIELLQFSTMDLSQFIVEQATDNPLIEIEQPPINGMKQMFVPKNNVQTIEEVRIDDISLRAYLQQQLIEASLPVEESKAIEKLIMNVDDKGYITENLIELSEVLKCDVSLLKNALTTLQTFDPPGVAAQTVQESLFLQLKRQEKPNHLAEKMVMDYIDEIARKNWDKISKECKTTISEVQDAYKVIRSLNPNPASQFGERTQYIVPDFEVTVFEGDVNVTLNDHLIPKIKINQQYDLLKNHPEAVDYIKVQLQHFRWLSRSISQRQNTLQRVMEQIISIQRSFFVEGPLLLAPLTMREIAEKLNMHESTVSRAVKNKHVLTSHGVYPLKTFFTSKVNTVHGKKTSSFVVKNRLANLISSEDKRKPLSDQKIVELLNIEGFNISRRAVAKYRNQLGILSSVMRKER